MLIHVLPSNKKSAGVGAVVIHCFCLEKIPCSDKIVDDVIKMHVGKEHPGVDFVQVFRHYSI